MTFVVRTADDLWELLRRESAMHPFRKPRPLLQIPNCLAVKRGCGSSASIPCASSAAALLARSPWDSSQFFLSLTPR